MKILCWNVNSIRTLRGALRTQFPATKPEDSNELRRLFDAFGADVVAFQETKLSGFDQLDKELACVPGYESFWSFSRKKKGSSGTVVYARTGSVVDAWEGFESERSSYADEGRCVAVDLGHFVLFCVYFPNGGASEERERYKMEFYRAFQSECRKLRASGRDVIVCGDVNTAHQEIDIFDPVKFANTTGFLPVEREWISEFLADGYEDAFRHFYPSRRDSFSFWDLRTQKKEVNQGWRIDVFYVSDGLMPRVKSCEIDAGIKGSDHAPITLDVDIVLRTGLPAPKLAASRRPEFSGRQKTISSFFKPKADSEGGKAKADKASEDKTVARATAPEPGMEGVAKRRLSGQEGQEEADNPPAKRQNVHE